MNQKAFGIGTMVSIMSLETMTTMAEYRFFPKNPTIRVGGQFIARTTDFLFYSKVYI